MDSAKEWAKDAGMKESGIDDAIKAIRKNKRHSLPMPEPLYE